MWPKRPAFEPQSIVQIRPLAARLVAKMRFEKIARAMYCWSHVSKAEGTSLGCAPSGLDPWLQTRVFVRPFFLSLYIYSVIFLKNCPGKENSKPPLGNSRTKIARAILAHGTAWKNSLGENFGEKMKS